MKRALLALALAAVPAGAVNQVLLRYLDIGSQGTAQVLAADPAGTLITVSALNDAAGHPTARVIKLDPRGTPLAVCDFHGSPKAGAVDPQGNLVVVGSADPATFPVTSKLFPAPSGPAQFVIKLDAQFRTVFSVLFGKDGMDGTYANAVAFDPAGNIYIAGATASADFPVTPGAYQTKPPHQASTAGYITYAFLMELSPNGDRLLYSTFFGGDQVVCVGGSRCVAVAANTWASALAVDPSGAVVIAGTTTAMDLPVTAGAVSTACPCDFSAGAGFVAKFMPGAPSQLVWSTYLSGSYFVYQGTSISALAIDSAGNPVVAGLAPAGLPVTPGVVLRELPSGLSGGFLAKLNSAGTAILWATYLGYGPYRFGVNGMALDGQGGIVATGAASAQSLPPLPPADVRNVYYVARLASDGTAIRDLYAGLSAPPTLFLWDTGRFTAAAGRAVWIETANAGPSLLAVTNSASSQDSGVVAPFEMVSLYGTGIGPQAGIPGEVKNDAFTTSLGGYQVLFDGVAAPLLYAGPGQINAVVPRAVTLRDSTHVEIAGPAGTLDGPAIPVTTADVGVFLDPQTGFAAALNQDGSINSPQNPAKPGSVVTVYANGAGNAIAYWPDGGLVPVQYARPVAVPVSVIGPLLTSLEVTYAGDAPGLVGGLMQINFRLPASIPPGPGYSFEVQVGPSSGPGASIAVAP